MKYLVAALLVMATPAFADAIAPQDAASHLGQTITVEGQATVRADNSGITYLDMGGAYPRNSFMAESFNGASQNVSCSTRTNSPAALGVVSKYSPCYDRSQPERPRRSGILNHGYQRN